MSADEILYHIEGLEKIYKKHPKSFDRIAYYKTIGILWKMYTEESEKEL